MDENDAGRTEAFQAHYKALNEARLQDAREAIRAAMLINGGAATAILGFAASLMAHGTEHLSGWLATSLVAFALGVASAAFAALSAYLANYAAAERRGLQVIRGELPAEDETPIPGARKWRVVALLAVVGSILLFVTGAFCAAGVVFNGQ